MSATIVTPWEAVRAGLEDTAVRFVDLTRAAPDGRARSVGEWTVGDTAAHVASVVVFDSLAVTGTEPPAHLADLAEPIRAAGIDDVAALNALALERDIERDPAVLAERIEAGVAQLLADTGNDDGAALIEWLGGMQLKRTAVVAHLLSELLVHGFDIARALQRPWPVPSSQAALTFELFLAEVVRAMSAMDPSRTSDRSLRPVVCELRPSHTAPVVIVSDGQRLSVGDPGCPVDVRLGGDAADLLLVMYRRVNPLGPLLRRRVRVSGRRPWRVARLHSLAP